jgi:hypothetical protein
MNIPICDIEKKDNSPECSILAEMIYDTITTDPSIKGDILFLTKRSENVSIVEFIDPLCSKGRHGFILSVQRNSHAFAHAFTNSKWMIDGDSKWNVSTTCIDINSDDTRKKNLKTISRWTSFEHDSIKDLVSAIRRYVSAHKDWSMPYDMYAIKFSLYYDEKSFLINPSKGWNGNFFSFYHRFYLEYFNKDAEEYFDESTEQSLQKHTSLYNDYGEECEYMEYYKESSFSVYEKNPDIKSRS